MLSRRWKHREQILLILGLFIVGVTLFALLTPWLSGPLFHPVSLLVGLYLVYISGLLLAGAARDQWDYES